MKLKKLTALSLAILSAITLFSCNKEKPAELSEGSGISRYTDLGTDTDNTVETEVQFNAAYSRTDGYIEKTTYPYVTVITTRTDLEKYTAEHEGLYNFYENSSSDGFYDIVTNYDAVFFADNSLVMIMLEENSGSVTHEVAGITCENGESVITINRILPEGDMTDDMAEWHIIVELPKDSPVLENPDKISVVVKDGN